MLFLKKTFLYGYRPYSGKCGVAPDEGCAGVRLRRGTTRALPLRRSTAVTRRLLWKIVARQRGKERSAPSYTYLKEVRTMEYDDRFYEQEGYQAVYTNEVDSDVTASGFERVVYVTVAVLALASAAVVYITLL